MLVGVGTAPAPARAAALYAAAVEDGSASAAAHYAVLAALGVGRSQSWTEAFDLLGIAAERGDASARRQLGVLSGEGGRLGAGEVRSAEVWRRVRAGLDESALLSPPRLTPIFERPSISVAPGLATPAMATWLIKRARPILEEALVVDPALGRARVHPMRDADVATFHMLMRDVIVAIMQERVARLTRALVHQHEPPNVISYAGRQRYEPHHDYVGLSAPGDAEEIARFGQRIATCLTYLNDDYDGAETEFPLLNWRYRGGVGDALLFFNVGADGHPNPDTLHAGLPPTRGRKWVLSQWIRNKTQALM